MSSRLRNRGDKKQRLTYVGKERVVAMHRPSGTTRLTKPSSLPRLTRPAGTPDHLRRSRSLSFPSLRIPRLSRTEGSLISAEHWEHKAPRLSTDKKVLLGSGQCSSWASSTASG